MAASDGYGLGARTGGAKPRRNWRSCQSQMRQGVSRIWVGAVFQRMHSQLVAPSKWMKRLAAKSAQNRPHSRCAWPPGAAHHPRQHGDQEEDQQRYDVGEVSRAVAVAAPRKNRVEKPP